tara:strand:- start:2396 stop:3316 length:921 start_codon:yes stop_codon:yes gene_type:complete
LEEIELLKSKIKGALLLDEPMSSHTSYGIGGAAMAFLTPKDEDDLSETLKFAHTHNLPVFFMGSGSNLLVSDDGFEGFVISLHKTFKTITIDETHVYAETGTMLGKLVKECMKNNLTGIESMIGVPGTLGGAIKMNAGAYGKEISNSLTQFSVMTLEGTKKTYKQGDITFDYRHSSIPDIEIILSAEFEFKKGNPEEIQVLRTKASQSRKTTQPLRFRSSGSVFKNPSKELAAGYLIDQVGLKGTKKGGAEISTKHANFFINHGGATAGDISWLIKRARSAVLEKFEIHLELEVKTLGFREGYFNA